MTATSQAFVDQMVKWVNTRFDPAHEIHAGTPLFGAGLIDSIRILELIAYTEDAIGGIIPDSRIRMDNFRTVTRIAEAFVEESNHVAA
ncbi:MAG: hypothetical protein H0U59_05525 [Gemmatimonadaceae bacterium]|nr:hypothetical protein [Gemmatimonadaceae bacterium]MDQ3243647.1 phosphopantetheine-binding protein [Gemmatimonadota bacterium]